MLHFWDCLVKSAPHGDRTHDQWLIRPTPKNRNEIKKHNKKESKPTKTTNLN
jgi:hypothetical protein